MQCLRPPQSLSRRTPDWGTQVILDAEKSGENPKKMDSLLVCGDLDSKMTSSGLPIAISVRHFLCTVEQYTDLIIV